MPPGPYSRHLLCPTLQDSSGRLFLGERARYLYRELEDNQFHRVVQGDTLFILAASYFKDVTGAALLYWVIADFQPDPILDVTIPLETGRLLVIPSLRVLTEEILSPGRIAEFEG